MRREYDTLSNCHWYLQEARQSKLQNHTYEGWNFNSGNYLFTTDTK